MPIFTVEFIRPEMQDIEIIAKLEERLPRKLKKLENITWFSKGYVLNGKGNVTHLSIFNVRLKGVFPEEIFLLKDLEYLDIRENGLMSIPPEIGLLNNLGYLDIRYNELTGLPEEFGKLTKLRKLYLGYNSFDDVPDHLDKLEKLYLIDLTENALMSGVEKLFKLPSLTNIYLQTNRLKSFPFDEVPHGKIIELNISENRIGEIPSFAFERIEKIIK